MTDITLRPARLEDTEGLAHCIDRAYEPFRKTIPDLPDVSAGLAEDIQDHTVNVAMAGDEIVGGSVLILSENRATLANIAVAPDQGGKGIGGLLIRQVEVDTKAAGHTELHLATHVDMPQNVKLYEHLGWKVTETTGHKVLMVKQL
ncbi:GNAT family N-acetyltransferase [Roseibium sediminis]|uniref:GNAT family N-acetyltransferase n=1 Tax=Roseibium sediminis TaxID=1775174 RepID=UPI00123E380E|nr:GNAT family N-acetyltransferase [Roseibium sediminis]